MTSFDPQKRAAELAWWQYWFEIQGGADGFLAQRHKDLCYRTAIFPQALNEGGVGLDLGCGLVSIFEFTSLNVIAADPLIEDYQKIFRYPRSRLLYVHTGYGTLPFGNARFDFVFCFNVIDHTPDSALVVNELYRILKPAGRLYFHVYFDSELTAPHYGLWRLETVERHFGQFHLQKQHCRIEEKGRSSFFALYVRPELSAPPSPGKIHLCNPAGPSNPTTANGSSKPSRC